MNRHDPGSASEVGSPVSFPAMGSEFEVLTVGDTETVAGKVRVEAAAIEGRFTRFSDDSELSHVNRTAGTWTPVSAEMFDVLVLAIDAQAWTAGIFNPLVLPAMVRAGYSSGTPAGTFDTNARIELDGTNRAVRIPPGHGLDLGGIVKGWTADRLVSYVQPNGFVNAGGDVHAVGPGEDGYGWVIGVEDARRPGYDAFVIALVDESAATSGRNRRHWERDGRDAHHLIDPRTGVPAETDVFTATAVSASCVRAEIAAKAAAILGSGPGLAFLEQNEVDGVVVRADGSWLATDGMRRRFL